MGTVPIPRTYTDGETIDKAILDQEIGVSLNWLLGRGPNTRPAAFAYSSSTLNVPNSTNTFIPLQVTLVDNDGMRPNANANIYCQTPGLYIIVGRVNWVSNAAGRRFTTIYKNGVQPTPAPTVSFPPSSGNVYMPPLFFPLTMAAGDSVGLLGNQDSGATLSTLAGSFLGAFWWSL